MLMLLLAAFLIIPTIWYIFEAIFDSLFGERTALEKQEKEDKKLAKYKIKLEELQKYHSPEVQKIVIKRRNKARKIAKWWFIIVGICVFVLFTNNS